MRLVVACLAQLSMATVERMVLSICEWAVVRVVAVVSLTLISNLVMAIVVTVRLLLLRVATLKVL